MADAQSVTDGGATAAIQPSQQQQQSLPADDAAVLASYTQTEDNAVVPIPAQDKVPSSIDARAQNGAHQGGQEQREQQQLQRAPPADADQSMTEASLTQADGNVAIAPHHSAHNQQQQQSQAIGASSAPNGSANVDAVAKIEHLPGPEASSAAGQVGGHTFQEMDAAQSLARNALEAQQHKASPPAAGTLKDPNLDPSMAAEGSGHIADTSMQDASDQSQAQPGSSAEDVKVTGHAAAVGGDEKADISANFNGDEGASAPSTPNKSGNVVLVASRKQNSACDACRSRKVRCNREPGEEKCLHCKAKGIDCTTLYVQWATSSAKRPSKRPRTSTAPSVEAEEVPKPVIEAAKEAQNRLATYLFQRDNEYPVEEVKTIPHAGLPFTSPSTSEGAAAKLLHSTVSSSVKPAASTTAELRLLDATTREAFMADLVESYFSVIHIRIPLLNPDVFKKRYYEKSEELGGPVPDVLLAVVLAFGAKVSQHSLIQMDREESAKELQKAYTSAQMALSRGETERAQQITGAKGGVDLPILTVPEHLRNQGRNRLGEDLLIRAMEVLDRVKAHRQVTVENIQACILAESLLYQPSTWSSDDLSLAGRPVPSRNRPATLQSQGFWYMCASRHLLELGINQKEVALGIKDPAVRAEMMLAWWTMCSADAASAVWTRRKPLIDDEDFGSESAADATAEDGEGANAPVGSESRVAYSPAVRDAAAINRKLADILRKPKHAVDGVRFELLQEVDRLISKWTDDHLERVGAPMSNWPADWDYLAAVTACCTDIAHHATWIVLWQCIDEFGVYGTDRVAVTSPLAQTHLRRKSDEERRVSDAPSAEAVSALVRKVQEAALAAAQRIASLVSQLHEQQYLRLDPGVLTQPLDAASRLLVRFQRAEAEVLVKAFRQMATSYEDGYEKADRIDGIYRVYTERARADPSFEPGSSLALALRRDVEREMAAVAMDESTTAAVAAVENADEAARRASAGANANDGGAAGSTSVETAVPSEQQQQQDQQDNDFNSFSALVALAHQQSQQGEAFVGEPAAAPPASQSQSQVQQPHRPDEAVHEPTQVKDDVQMDVHEGQPGSAWA